MNAVTHLEKVITGEVSAVTHLEKVIAGETSAVTYTEKVITGEAPPITHLQKVITGEASPVTHLEYIWAGGTPSPTEHEYTGAVPYTFTANGSPLMAWRISGNTVQSTTPTPDNPIMPQGCGERTGNIVAAEADRTSPMPGLSVVWKKGGSEMIIDGKATGGDSARFATFELDAGTYTLSITGLDETGWNKTGFYLSGVDTARVQDVRTYTITEPTIAKLQFVVNVSDISYENRKVTIMFTKTSTALPYEPYGYKLDISSGDTTTPVYLGEVETTRKIKKLVLTGGGDEQYAYDPPYTRFYFVISNMLDIGVRLTPLYCTHYQNISDGRPIGGVPNNSIYTGGGIDADKAFIKTTDYTSVADFKSYLAAQYAAGTPVTIWYVLATEETGIVNEPLMKIGDYADEASNAATIPTNNGSTTIDVDTTVKPSEVYIKYKGV